MALAIASGIYCQITVAKTARTRRAARTHAKVAAPAETATPVAVAPPVESATAVTSATAGGDPLAPFVGKRFINGPASVKKIALTFDDGPSGKLTPQYLAILKQEKVPATFFMLGDSVRKFPTMARQVADSGFDIGCHSYSHRSLNRMGMDEIRKEIIGTSEMIEQATGKRPRFFRPPYGLANANVLKVCGEGNEVLVTWSVDTNDWKPRNTPERIHDTIMREAHGGSVILMHDVHERSVKVLAQVIQELKAKGYQFVTLTELIADAANHKMEAAAGVEEAAEPAARRPVSIPLSQSAIK